VILIHVNSGHGSIAGTCEDSNETPASIRNGEFHDC
jgi:hypothetical protein